MAEITDSTFHFFTVSNIAELTGLEAANLKQLVNHLKTVSLDSVFYHTHKFLREHLYTGGAFTNDFAYWTGAHTPYKVLAEKLANIDILCFTDLAELRNTFIETIETFLKGNPDIPNVPKGEEFHFCNMISIVLPTRYVARNLGEFAQLLRKVDTGCIYYHFIEARLRLGHRTNDFSNWISTSVSKQKLAQEIERLDPYLDTLQEIRAKIRSLIRKDKPWPLRLWPIISR